ncbi:MAG: hypothetical protein ACREHF_15260 [Rhizomicrobium sp.]
MPEQPVTYLMDVPAVKSWADAKANERTVVLTAVKAGTVLIYNRVWDSAKSAFPDECETLPKDEFVRKRCNEEHRLAAAAVAESLNATFPIRGGYDDAIEWTVVGVALSGGYTVVTDERRKQKYQKIDGLLVVTYDELLDLL